jgi:hypothetical protein
LEEGSTSQFIQELLVNALSVVQCCLPFGVYKKKLSASLAKITAQYSQMDESTQILAFQSLRALIIWNNPKQDSSLFEFAVKVNFSSYNDLETV